MSSDRSTNRPVLPTVATTRTAKPPITPRIATSVAKSAYPTVPSSVKSESAALSPRTANTSKVQDGPGATRNVTPRSSARKARLTGSNSNTPSSEDHKPTASRTTAVLASSHGIGERLGNTLSRAGGSHGHEPRHTRSHGSVMSDTGKTTHTSPLAKAPGCFDNASVGSRFFHANDAPKLEPVRKNPEPRKPAGFFYADGRREKQQDSPDAGARMPSTRREVRSPRSDRRVEPTQPSVSPGAVSPGRSVISSITPLFASPVDTAFGRARSPSPGKGNLHLSYRKGVSQIFGTHPSPVTHAAASGAENLSCAVSPGRKSSLDSTSKSTILPAVPTRSSIDAGCGRLSLRRSTVTSEISPDSPPLQYGVKSAPFPSVSESLSGLPTLEPAAEHHTLSPTEEVPLSPTKSVSELAAHARQERKVLDLEISNSSLLAINASLEREVSRQKAELKSFRRLSRSGRLSSAPGEHVARDATRSSAVGEEGSLATIDFCSEISDDESVDSDFEPLSPVTSARRQSDRLAKDEKRLRLDLEKHRELLVQSQMMNQSLKRCSYATEEMIREGRRALDYRVQVSDVKLGGRVLSNTEESGGEDDVQKVRQGGESFRHGPVGHQAGALNMWSGVPSTQGDERDSGIGIERASLPHGANWTLASPAGNLSAAGTVPAADRGLS